MPNKLFQFWQELKRRKVLRVITVYAGAAFVILELVSMSEEPFGLPDWTFVLAVILLSIGFLIAIILSWIYDIHPEGGIVKTEPAHQVKPEDIPKSSNGWKIASYISFVVIVGLVVLNILGITRIAKIDESLAKSIAVLPFHNLSGDLERDYICDGLTDEIIGHLFKVNSFDKVVSYTSVYSYKDPDRNISKIAEELSVNYILEGSYKRMGNEIKITAQLIEPRSDKHIWIKDYELSYAEVPVIPGEIALQMADHLKAFISKDVQKSIDRRPTTKLEAYELIRESKSQYYSHFYAATDIELDLAKQAIKLDPNYSEAYAWTGYLLLTHGFVYGIKSIQTVVWDALSNFEQALKLDPSNATAHSGLGRINEFQKYDYVMAESELQTSIELEPNNSATIITYIEFLLRRHRMDDAILYIQKISGNEAFKNLESLWLYSLTGNQDNAQVFLDSVQTLNVNHSNWIGQSLVHMQEYDLAISYLEPIEPRSKAFLALAQYQTKNNTQALQLVTQLKRLEKESHAGSPDFFLGFYYSGIREIDSAFYWLENAFENRSPELSWLKTFPEFDILKRDDRYWDLYERTGHKAYDDYMASK